MCIRDRSKAVSRILKSWKVIILALDELKAEVARDDVKCNIDGLYKLMSKMKTYCGVILCQAIFGPCEGVAVIKDYRNWGCSSVKNADASLSKYPDRAGV